MADAFFTSRIEQLAALTVHHAVPAVYEISRVCRGRRSAELRSGTRQTAYRLAGNYTGRILKGDKPADLPVQQLTKVEMYINLKTAKALGITVPNTLYRTRRRGDRMKRRGVGLLAP